MLLLARRSLYTQHEQLGHKKTSGVHKSAHNNHVKKVVAMAGNAPQGGSGGGGSCTCTYELDMNSGLPVDERSSTSGTHLIQGVT